VRPISSRSALNGIDRAARPLLMLFGPYDQKPFLQNRDSFIKRITLFSLAIGTWWSSEHYLRPLCGGPIQQARNYFGNGPFIQNIFSQSLPTDIVCFAMLTGLCVANVLPAPKIRATFSTTAREGSFWGLLICIPTIFLAVHLGFHVGFEPNWQNILGNVISNSYEELTYRVFLFSIAAYTFKNIWIGVLIAAILFASIHTQYPISMQVIVGLASVFFSLAYIRSKTVFATLWAHQLSDMILDSILF
jgi:membrane protease YdiL (CAAX protease family)